MRWVLWFSPLIAALALFLLVWAGLRFSLLGLLPALALGGGVGLGLVLWQGGHLRRPLGTARERLAFKEAWRRGGVLTPKDLAPYLGEEGGREVLEALAQKGVCRKEGEAYRF